MLKLRNWLRAAAQRSVCGTLYFLPLLIAGGRMAVRMMLNLWNMIEPGGPHLDHTTTGQF